MRRRVDIFRHLMMTVLTISIPTTTGLHLQPLLPTLLNQLLQPDATMTTLCTPFLRLPLQLPCVPLGSLEIMSLARPSTTSKGSPDVSPESSSCPCTRRSCHQNPLGQRMRRQRW